MTPARYQWIDNCKALGLLLVILGHGRLLPDSWQQFIYSFHMPLFFFLSGLLYKYKSPQATLQHDVRRLLIPYLLINIICWIIQCGMLYMQGGLSWNVCYSRFIGIFVVACHTGAFPPVSGPTWFIVTLFIAQILLSLKDSRTYRYMLAILSILSFLLLKKMSIDTWLPLDSALMAIPFIVIGIEAGFVKSVVVNKKWSLSLLFICLLMTPLLFILNQENDLVDMAWSSFGNSLALFYINGLIGTLVLVVLSKITPPHCGMGQLGLYNNFKRIIIGYRI